MFKENWEKTDSHVKLSTAILEKMVRMAFPDKSLLSCHTIAGGCANLNYKIEFKNEKTAYILRVYLRDKEASSREQKLGTLLNPIVPVPTTYYIDEVEGYHFAITQFMSGITLRSLLLGNFDFNLADIMNEVGTILSNISAHTFKTSGFFDKNLKVIPSLSSDEEMNFLQDCLQDKNVCLVLSAEIRTNIQKTFDTLEYLLPRTNARHLVHGDFDPANILVDTFHATWKISSILDWEFAFSGSNLWDVANMLRYAHLMPSTFQDAFIKGLTKGGMILPDNWQKTIYLLNLLSLLDLLKRQDALYQPRKCADIRELINYMLQAL